MHSGTDRPVEVRPELGVVLADPGRRMADRPGHGDSSALGRGRGPSITTMESDRARQLLHEEAAFDIGLHLAVGVSEGARLLDVVVDLCEAAAVCVLCPSIEELARIAEVPTRRTQRRADLRRPSVPVSAATRSSTWNSWPGWARSRAR